MGTKTRDTVVAGSSRWKPRIEPEAGWKPPHSRGPQQAPVLRLLGWIYAGERGLEPSRQSRFDDCALALVTRAAKFACTRDSGTLSPEACRSPSDVRTDRRLVQRAIRRADL